MEKRTVFTLKIKEQILAYLRAGSNKSTAAHLCGVSYRTFHNWMRYGHEKPGTLFEGFHTEVLRAEAEFEADCVRMLTDTQNPKYILEVLSRRAPDRWSSSTRINLQVDQKIEDFMNFLIEALSEDRDTLTKVLEVAAEYEKANYIE